MECLAFSILEYFSFKISFLGFHKSLRNQVYSQEVEPNTFPLAPSMQEDIHIFLEGSFDIHLLLSQQLVLDLDL